MANLIELPTHKEYIQTNESNIEETKLETASTQSSKKIKNPIKSKK